MTAAISDLFGCWIDLGLAANEVGPPAVPLPMGKRKSGQTATSTLRASVFELVDHRGNVRAALKIWPHGRPGLAFFDTTGQVRLVIGIDENDQPLLVLTDEAGGRRLDLRVLGTGAPSLALLDDEDRPRLKIDLAGAGGEPCLVLLDAEGKPRVGAMIGPDGQGIVGPMNPGNRQ